MDHLSRRAALQTAAGTLLAAGAAAGQPRPGLTVRQNEPRNLEAPFGDLDTFLTPTDQFYVRSHFAVPAVDPAAYKLTVEGAVETPLALTLADLKALPQVTVPLTLECAGNGRVFLAPAARGLQWQFGGVSTAEWTGVPLSAILEKAKAKPNAVEVILVGADRGAITSDPPSPGPIAYDRSIPIAKARRPEVILAHGMNGEPLAASHGAPVRAVIGGWYGMASVKWLTRIIVTDRPYDGFWQTFDYSYFERRDGGLPTLRPVTEAQPKAQIARPGFGEVIPAGREYKVRGFAWAGEQSVAKVEVSTDGGAGWANATLVGEEKPFCWRAWEFAWTPGTRGPVKLLARCADVTGRGQPEKRDPDRRTYMINHLVPVEATVR